MRILYGSTMSTGTTGAHRLRAFRRQLPDVVEFSFDEFLDSPIPGVRRWSDRLQTSPTVMALNSGLIAAAKRSEPDVIWLDKPVLIYRRTIEKLSAMGAKVIAYNPDDPFGPRGDPCWRHFVPALTAYWGHVVPREPTRQEYHERGVERCAMVTFTYEPSLHFPPEMVGLTVPKTYDFTFIGYPHDERARWIRRIADEVKGVRFGLFGPGWEKYAASLREVGIACNGPLWDDQYRDAFWRSRLSISFITRANRDRMSRKAIEIAASGCAVFVQPSSVHDAVFKDGESAIFFDDPNELPSLLNKALADPERLSAIGAEGAKAVRRAGMSNDVVFMDAFKQLGLL